MISGWRTNEIVGLRQLGRGQLEMGCATGTSATTDPRNLLIRPAN